MEQASLRLRMRVRTVHRTSAMVLVAFACLHIANHLASLWGVPAHIAFMRTARLAYRQPAVETLLLACVGFQAGSGAWLVLRGWKQRRGALAWLQAASGMFLAFFLLVHVGAVLYGRWGMGLDTNFYFAAAGLHTSPARFFFAPYYFLGVLALFTHLACAAWWRLHRTSRSTRTAVLTISIAAGSVVALLIVLSLAGKLAPVEIPAPYRATFAQQPKD